MYLFERLFLYLILLITNGDICLTSGIIVKLLFHIFEILVLYNVLNF